MKEIEAKDLPTWEHCDKIYSNEVVAPNALEIFIYGNEPMANDKQWREDLANVINYALEKYSDSHY